MSQHDQPRQPESRAQRKQPDNADLPTAADDDFGEPMEGDAYGASSAESGGNYDDEGPTSANIEGEPMDAEETTGTEPSPS
jgi:hypothetical protein